MEKAIVLRGGPMKPSSRDAVLLNGLAVALAEKAPVAAESASVIFATESLNEQQHNQVQVAASNLEATLAAVLGELNFDGGTKRVYARESAAVYGGLCASAPEKFLGRSMNFPKHSTSDVIAIGSSGVPDYLGHRSKLFATEAFDNRETRSAVLYTMAYNYSVAQQNDFGETIWPTLVLPSDQVGFGILVNRLTVRKNIKHTIDGKVVDFGKVDLMRAAADSTILSKNKTRIYPHVRADALSKFVAAAVIPAYDIDNEGATVTTAPLKVGEEIGLIGLGQSDASLDGGLANVTDTLDPAVQLEKLYVKVGDDILAFNVYGMPTANFTYPPQGMDKQRNLAFKNRALRIKPTTKQHGGADLVTLAVIASKKLTVTVEMHAAGELNTEFGSITVYGNKVAVFKVIDETGAVLPKTNANVQDIMTAFANAEIVGYDVRAYLTNINMRENGDYIDRTSFTQLYEVPLLSPVTAQRPQNTDGQLDAGDFEALVTLTKFRLQNDSVTAILEAVERLRDHVETGGSSDDLPSLFGASRFHVKPVFKAPPAINLVDIVDSLTSSNRIADLNAAIVNVLRDNAFRMFVESEYQPAKDALGITGPTTIIIACDPRMERYLMVDGDLRTLTEKFNVRIVSTIDSRFKGKIFMTFGVFDEQRNQAPCLLNWGNLIWSPELVMSAMVPRGESLSRETIVQPRYLFVQHLPIAAWIEVEGIEEVFSKLPMEMHQVP